MSLCLLRLLAAALGNIVSVLFLFFFIYAVIGMNLWGTVKPGPYLNRHANFQNVGIALLTLFRMITGGQLSSMVAVQPHSSDLQNGSQAVTLSAKWCNLT